MAEEKSTMNPQALVGALAADDGAEVSEAAAAARSRLFAAPDRDAIIDQVLQFARERFPYAAAFTVAKGYVQGVDALGDDREADRKRVRKVRVPTHFHSLFHPVVNGATPYLGPVQKVAVSQLILRDMGRGEPDSVLLVPVHMAGRPVAVFYADNGSEPVTKEASSELLEVTGLLPAAFQQLILARK